ncbi:hypothetical protein [Burkholderia guangdongensis]|uniref:hypothetical protein n=1 Tax=Burkholderia guangdongensis TaxID=1792500 RepID=UPI0015CA7CC8|nr:hypothetical protein [Burkholderia guangdongensis]
MNTTRDGNGGRPPANGHQWTARHDADAAAPDTARRLAARTAALAALMSLGACVQVPCGDPSCYPGAGPMPMYAQPTPVPYAPYTPYAPAPDDMYLATVVDTDVVLIGGDTYIWFVGSDGARHRRFYAHGDRRQDVFRRRDELHNTMMRNGGRPPGPSGDARGPQERGGYGGPGMPGQPNQRYGGPGMPNQPNQRYGGPGMPNQPNQRYGGPGMPNQPYQRYGGPGGPNQNPQNPPNQRYGGPGMPGQQNPHYGGMMRPNPGQPQPAERRPYSDKDKKMPQ